MLFLWLARSLSTADFANFGLLYALQQGLATFAIAGIVEATIGLLKNQRKEDQYQLLFRASNLCFVVMSACAVPVALFIWALYLRSAQVLLSTSVVVTIGGILLAFSSLQAQIVRLEEKHLWSLAFSFIPPSVSLIGGAVAFWLYKTAAFYFVGYAAGLFISLTMMRFVRIGNWTSDAKIPLSIAIFRGAAPFMAVAIVGWLSGYGNNYILNVIFEPLQIARFTFALGLSSTLQLVASALNQVWSPRFFRTVHTLPSEEIEIRNKAFFRIQAMALGLVGGLVIAFFPRALSWVGGNLTAYRSMTLEMSLLFASYVLLSPWWHCNNYYLVHGKGRELMNVVLATSATGVAVWILLMWLLGPIGIYVGFFLQMLVRTLGIVLSARRRWSVTIAWDGVVGGIVFTTLGYLFAVSQV